MHRADTGPALLEGPAPWIHYTHIAFFRAYADLRADVAKAYLGIGWWVLEPLLYVCAFYLAFSFVIPRGTPAYLQAVLLGILSFRWFATSVATGAGSLVAHAPLMRLAYLPKLLFPVTSCIAAALKFSLVMGLLLIALGMFGPGLSTAWLALPLLLALQFALNLGVASLAAALVPFARDLRMAVDNGLILTMFVSGVFFDMRQLPEAQQAYLAYNPLALLIDALRGCVVYHEWPDPARLGTIALFAAGFLAAGAWTLRRYDRHYPKVL